MDDSTPSKSKIDLSYPESRVAFSFRDCSLDKKYSFYELGKEKAKKLITRLGHIEKMTWRQLVGLLREEGLTPEKPNSPSFEMIDNQNSSGQKISGEKYYFHIRIEEAGLFRVFGYQEGPFFCITHIDPNGKIHHHD